MTKIRAKTFLNFGIVLAISLMALLLSASPVLALTGPTTCPSGSSLKIDFSCQRALIINPNTTCNVNYCDDGSGTAAPYTAPTDSKVNINFLGIAIHLNSATAVSQILLLIFSLCLGVIALVLVGRAAYAAYLRAQADDPKDAAKAFQIVQNSIVGFVIIVIALVIVQLVASFIGVGSITDMIDFREFFDRSTISTQIGSCTNGGDPASNCQ